MKLIINFFKNNELILSVALLLSLTIGFFGPSHIFLTNQLEFDYLYGDIFYLLLFISFFIFLFVFLILFFWGRLRFLDIGNKFIVFVFGIGFLIWLQSNFLVREFGVFDGSLIDWLKMTKYIKIDNFVWISILLLFFIFSSKLIRNVKKISILLIFIQLIYLIYVCIFFNIDNSRLKYKEDLTNKFNFSNEKNVIVLLLDTVQSDVFHEVLNEDNRYSEVLSGFRYYVDTLGGYPTTYASIPLIFTGKYYKNEIPIIDFIKNEYLNNSILSKLRENNIVTEIYDGKNPVFYDEDIISNIIPIDKKNDFSINFMNNKYFKYIPYLYDVSLFRFAPTRIKQFLYNDGDFWLKNITKSNESGLREEKIDPSYSNVFFANDFVEMAKKIEKGPVFKYYYLYGAHPPFTLTNNLIIREKVLSIEGYKEAMRGLMTMIDMFLNKLKSIGCFDNSMIVILSDHGNNIHLDRPDFVQNVIDSKIIHNSANMDVRGSAMPLLLIKPFGIISEKLQIDTTKASLVDVSKTILSSLSINSNEFEGLNLLANNLNINRERHFYYYKWIHDAWKSYYLPDMEEYVVNEDSRNIGSWAKTYLIHSANGIKKNISINYQYQIGDKLIFGKGNNGSNYLYGGWAAPDGDYNWSDNRIATLYLNLSELPQVNAKLKMLFEPLYPQKVLVYIDSELIGDWSATTLKEYEMLIPKDKIKKNIFTINFVLPAATKSPKDLGMSEDVRKLGIAVYSLELN